MTCMKNKKKEARLILCLTLYPSLAQSNQQRFTETHEGHPALLILLEKLNINWI